DPTFAILKHTNACGLASRPHVLDAWTAALACDPVSAFGGVLITNEEIDEQTAIQINTLFFEVLIAPSYTSDALSLLKSKKNRFELESNPISLPIEQFKTFLNGENLQNKVATIEEPQDMPSVTTKTTTSEHLKDLAFANNLVKHSK